MLSPHEFAVLLLLNDDGGAESRAFNREDVEALIERQLVVLARRAPGHCHAHVPLQGYPFLKASGHTRASRRKAVPATR